MCGYSFQDIAVPSSRGVVKIFLLEITLPLLFLDKFVNNQNEDEQCTSEAGARNFNFFFNLLSQTIKFFTSPPPSFDKIK